MQEETKQNPQAIDELAECKKTSEEYLNNWKRSAADFANYKKEEIERMAMLGNYAKESMVLKILPIFDSFYLAETNMPEELKSNTWSVGFLQIKKQMEEFLKKEGIEEIKTIGEAFNPETMDVVEEVEGEGSGTVAEELQKGYLMDKKVLRPAKVKAIK